MKAESPPAACVIGLTGGIGSGKSTVAGLFETRGAGVVDTDHLAHALTAPGGAAMPAILARFGADVVRADGALDRVAMRARAFADPAERKALEAILHPLIRAAARTALDALDTPYALLVVPLLIETGHYLPWCQCVVVVDCRRETQIARVMARNGQSRKEVECILATQASRTERLAVADAVIDNEGKPELLSAQVENLHRVFMALAQKLDAGRML